MPKRKNRLLILGIGFSPRAQGNSDILLEWALKRGQLAGARVKKILVRDLRINHCLGCRYCEKSGDCIQKDDFQKLCKEMDRADFLIIATPIFFLGIPSHSKAMIDRFQTYWSRKYLLDRPLKREGRKALILMVGGSNSKKLFEAVKKTISAWFLVSGFKIWKEIGIKGVDKKAEVREVPGLRRQIENAVKEMLRLNPAD